MHCTLRHASANVLFPPCAPDYLRYRLRHLARSEPADPGAAATCTASTTAVIPAVASSAACRHRKRKRGGRPHQSLGQPGGRVPTSGRSQTCW